MFYAYMLQCRDDTYYVGHTDDLEKRLSEHDHGIASSWTRSRRPVELVWHAAFGTRDEAKAAERQIKGWNRAKKEALARDHFGDIQTLSGRGAGSRALRDALLRRAPQEHG